MSGASLPTQIVKHPGRIIGVLIPDEWGKSSDTIFGGVGVTSSVLIPDEWGKSSDVESALFAGFGAGLNPR